MAKLVHDKISYNSSYRPIKYNCEGPLNALSVNTDFSQVVVAGRAVFKVLNIKDDCFTEGANLRKQRNSNLNYAAADVVWHPADNNMLASAALNGSVVLWDLNQSGKSKQVWTFADHRRAVNRVEFHKAEYHQLLSASQDGVVMIHDIREKKVCMEFGATGTDSVRDAQFCSPSSFYFVFAAAYENGGIQIWDTRRPDRCERQFIAHQGPVFSLDWHPSEKSMWLATAGRDTMINVWEMSRNSDRSSQPECLYSITNIAPVARVKWRPQRRHHISSCFLNVDHSINVWDVNRPYIPFAVFEGHVEVGTGIQWRDDCHTFLTCGKDGYVIQHVFADAKRPADNVNLSGLDISISGQIGSAIVDKTGGVFEKNKSNKGHFTTASSSLYVFEEFPDNPEVDEEAVVLKYFVEMAQRYKLKGSSLVDMCWHNGNVAEDCRKPQISQSWRLLATMFSPHRLSDPSNSLIPKSSSFSQSGLQQDMKDKVIKPALKNPKEKSKRKTHKSSSSHSDSTYGNERSSEAEGDASDTVDKNSQEMQAGIDLLFGDGNDHMNHEIYRDEMLEEKLGEWNIQLLPFEGIQLQHELQAVGINPLAGDDTDFGHNQFFSQTVQPEVTKEIVEHSEATIVVKELSQPPLIDLSSVVAEMITYFAEQGDVQTVVTMLIVLGDTVRLDIDEGYQESWFFAYIDLLSRFELWTIANSVIKQSQLMSVCSLNQESTVTHTQCFKCSRAMERVGWVCDKCKKISSLCTVCHLQVKGLMVWCQGCCHGGHKEHIREWLTISEYCPAGCGHRCEYV